MTTVTGEGTTRKLSPETPSASPRRISWWWLPVAGLTCLGVGLIVGAAGWQATRSDATASVRTLAERYAAAPFFSPAQAAMFSSNARFVDATTLQWSQGHVRKTVHGLSAILYMGTIEQHMESHHQVSYSAKEKVILVGPDRFVTEWTLRGNNPALPPVHGVSVCTVKNGKITFERFFYDNGRLV